MVCCVAGFASLRSHHADAPCRRAVRISGSIILGILALWAFVKHETVTTKPFMPRRLLDNRTIRAGCLLGCFHFICQFTYESYFTSCERSRVLYCFKLVC